MMVVWNRVVEADREQKTDLKYILEEVTGLNKRLGEEGSKGKESKMILRGVALVTMWMTVLVSEIGKIRFGMMGKRKCFLSC